MSAEIDPDMLPMLEAMRAAPSIDYAAMLIGEARKVFDQGAALWSAMAPELHTVRDLTLDGATGPMRARLYLPAAGRLPLIVYVHGGGWTFGSVDSHENEMRYLALGTGAAVLGFDYGLAPERPFPAGIDDTVAVIAAARRGVLGEDIDAARLALAGDSAGANLALGALLALRRTGVPLPRAAALFYGCYAPDFSTESHRLFGGGQFGLTSARMRWYWQNFLAVDAIPPEVPISNEATPLAAELSGLPPLYLLAAGLDPLRDDTPALARRAAAAGVAHEFITVPGVIHGFLGRAPRLPAARKALAAAGAFLAQHLIKREER
ncbi:MAG: alpha/beta hydrolase fold domain-containing protein [Devosia sp.]